MSGFVVWFTGLSGAGKSTLGAMLAAELRSRGEHVELLDGDEVRTHLSKGLGFSREDRDTNVRRIGFVAKLVARSGGIAITAAISPFRAIREEQRAAIGRFVEVYCCSSIEALAARDPKGLYRKALAGEIKGFTGIDDPYEAPEAPDVTVFTDRESKEESLQKILLMLETRRYLAKIEYPKNIATGATIGASLLPPGATIGASLLPPHGGELSSRKVGAERRDRFLANADAMPVIDLNAQQEATLDLFASGALSPLKGFLCSKDYIRVLSEMRLENGLPWPVPITLPYSVPGKPPVPKGDCIALRARNRQIVAILEVEEVFCPATLLSGRRILEDSHTAPPWAVRGSGNGGERVVVPQYEAGTFFVGGEVHVLVPHVTPAGALALEPAQARRRFNQPLYKNAAFLRHARAPFRELEHSIRLALELTGTLILQVTFDPSIENAALFTKRLDAHRVLSETYFDPERAVTVASIASGYRGPRGAVLDAIICQNFGARYVVLPSTSYSCDTSALEAAFGLFSRGELVAAPIFLERAFYSPRVGHYVSTRSAPLHEAPSDALSSDDLRPEVARILMS